MVCSNKREECKSGHCNGFWLNTAVIIQQTKFLQLHFPSKFCQLKFFSVYWDNIVNIVVINLWHFILALFLHMSDISAYSMSSVDYESQLCGLCACLLKAKNDNTDVRDTIYTLVWQSWLISAVLPACCTHCFEKMHWETYAMLSHILRPPVVQYNKESVLRIITIYSTNTYCDSPERTVEIQLESIMKKGTKGNYGEWISGYTMLNFPGCEYCTDIILDAIKCSSNYAKLQYKKK